MFNGSSTGLSSTASWLVEGQGSSVTLGETLASGDVNSDGYSDIIVAAPGPYWVVSGAVYVYHGSSTGPSTSPDASLFGESVGDEFGNSLASGADQNGDGYDDLLVGAHLADYNSVSQSGKVYLFRGSSTGLSSSATWSDGGTQQSEEFGASVALGLIDDSDFSADVAIGAPSYDTTALSLTNDGRVKVYITDSITLLPVWQVSNNGLYDGVNLGRSVAIGDPMVDGEINVMAGVPNGDANVPNVQVWEYSP